MKLEKIKQLLCDGGYQDSIVLENPDYSSAIIGITESGNVVYDYEKMVASLMAEDEISAEEALDFIEFNTIRAIPYMGEKRPVIFKRIEGLYV